MDMLLGASRIVDSKHLENSCSTWGLDQEGEPRGVWKPNGRTPFISLHNILIVKFDRTDEALWFVPGGAGGQRFNCRLVALQILAALRGFRLPVYTETPSDL